MLSVAEYQHNIASNINDTESPLNAMQRAALLMYTSASPAANVAPLSEYMRAMMDSKDALVTMPFISHVLDALDRVPKIAATVCRLVRLSDDDDDDDDDHEYMQGQFYVWTSIVSVSLQMSVVDEIIEQDDSHHYQIMIIEACSVADIRLFSQCSSECECVLMPGTVVEVLSVLKMGGNTLLRLKQVA